MFFVPSMVILVIGNCNIVLLFKISTSTQTRSNVTLLVFGPVFFEKVLL